MVSYDFIVPYLRGGGGGGSGGMSGCCQLASCSKTARVLL